MLPLWKNRMEFSQHSTSMKRLDTVAGVVIQAPDSSVVSHVIHHVFPDLACISLVRRGERRRC